MSDFSIVNLNNFTWQLNIAIAGGAFAVFSLIYNEKYIYYGLITFVFGVCSHAIYLFCEWIFREKSTGSKYYWIAHLVNALVVAAWLSALLWIY